MRITDNDLKYANEIIKLLRANDSLGPSAMGLHMGFKYDVASSKLSSVLKKLVAYAIVNECYVGGRKQYTLNKQLFENKEFESVTKGIVGQKNSEYFHLNFSDPF